MRTTATTDSAPPPAGSYSQVARAGGIVAAAGQVGRRPGGTLCEGLEAQARRAYANLLAALAAGGAKETDVISVRVYLTDPSHAPVADRVFGDVFTEPRPARTTVTVTLSPMLLIEVDALAVVTV